MGSEASSPDHWTEKTVGEMLATIIDYRGKTPPKSNSGIPLISAANVSCGKIKTENLKYISQEDYEDWTTRGFTQPGDILITTEAPAGEVAEYPRSGTWLISRRVMALRADPKQLNNLYLLYALQSQHVKSKLLSVSRGSTVPRVLKTDITNLNIPLPPLPEQRAIASVLGALDDRIELNRRMNRTLEAMARALFKHWFIDFKPPPGSAPYTLQPSELGDIPEGWEVRPLKDVVDLTMGQSPSSEHYNQTGEGLPFHQGVSDHGFRYPSRRVFCTVEGRMANAGDVLLSVRAPVGRINVADERMVLGRGLAGMRHKENQRSFLLYLMQYLFAEDDAVGDGTIYKSVNKKFVEEMPLITPPLQVAKKFETLAVSVDNQIQTNIEQSRTLAALRDALLPKLLSGELSVAELEEAAK